MVIWYLVYCFAVGLLFAPFLYVLLRIGERK